MILKTRPSSNLLVNSSRDLLPPRPQHAHWAGERSAGGDEVHDILSPDPHPVHFPASCMYIWNITISLKSASRLWPDYCSLPAR